MLRKLELSELFEVTVSSEEVARGKPAPDVYLEAARRLGVDPARCVAIEDSASGIRAAHAAGMRVIAYPNRHYPPAPDVLALGDAVVDSCRPRRRRPARGDRRRPAGEVPVVSGSSSLVPILHWPSIPVNAALFPATRDESLAVPRGSFRLLACETCGFLFNGDHDEGLAEYSTRCIETPAHSPHHRAFRDALAQDWVDRHGLREQAVVEVGCGHEAEFLHRCRARRRRTARASTPPAPFATPTRFDAAGSGSQPTTRPSRVARSSAGTPSSTSRASARSSGDVRGWAEQRSVRSVLFEVPDAGRILEQGAFWDMYYEHCSYFTSGTLAVAFRAAGLEPGRGELVYGGQYLVARGGAGEHVAPDPATAAPVVRAALDRRRNERPRRAGGELARALHADGPVVLWQAGGKALSLLTLTGTENLVPGIVDVNRGKRGRYLPGTGIEILAPEDLQALRPRHVVVLNEVYLDESARCSATCGSEASLRSVARSCSLRRRAGAPRRARRSRAGA